MEVEDEDLVRPVRSKEPHYPTEGAHYSTEDTTRNGKYTYCHNLDQTIIAITEDKVKLALIKYEDNRQDNKAWITPIGFFITFGMIPITTNCKDAFGLSAAVWQAIFILLIGVSVIWFIYSLSKARSKKMTLDDVVNEMKNVGTPTRTHSTVKSD